MKYVEREHYNVDIHNSFIDRKRRQKIQDGNTLEMSSYNIIIFNALWLFDFECVLVI